MVERVRNVIKRDYKMGKRPASGHDATTPKRRKRGDELLKRYPITDAIVNSENAESLEQHKKAISKELAKTRPRDSILLPLMKSTYDERRMYVLNDATSVNQILSKYPALCHPAMVCCINWVLLLL